jgi:hypothetical protein
MHHRVQLNALFPALAASILRTLCVLWALMIGLSAHAALNDQAADGARLDVGILIFDPGIPADESTHSKLGIFPEIRKSEAKYMPVILREVFMESGDWGAVRVLPEALASSELLVTGTIIRSDGQQLELQIQVRDATGVLWLDRIYSGTTTPSDYPVKRGEEPFLSVYKNVGADMAALQRQMSSRQLIAIRELALMRYAGGLAPEVFASYLTLSPEGEYALVRLPAEGDPMMDRVIRIRNQEYRFIDTVDEQFVRLSEEMAPTYNLWRQYGAEQSIFREDYKDRVSSRESESRRGSFTALEQTYNTYKWSKIHEQDLDELALGFNNEVAPTVMDVSGTVFKLSGTLQSQYTEWREILREIFALESGLAPTS